jgi:hypothetical protein
VAAKFILIGSGLGGGLLAAYIWDGADRTVDYKYGLCPAAKKDFAAEKARRKAESGS